MHSISFWKDVEKILGIAKPFVDLLRLVDSEKLILRQVYWQFLEAIQFAKENTQFTAREKNQIISIANTRWSQMHTPLHKVAFALEPKF